MNSPDSVQDVPYPRPAYAWYVVVVLLLAYILAFVDREIIAQLVPAIKKTLVVSDTQMSLILGGAFAIFYCFCGIPLAWLADRGNRRWLIFGGVTLWSLMTCACGLAGSYMQLFLARVGVGAGEGALNPPALSLLKDYFPKETLGRAIGLYTAGVSSGSGLAFIIGGTLYPLVVARGPQTWPMVGSLEPWQQMFIYVGLPGLLVAALILTIREPVRRESLNPAVRIAPASTWQVLQFLAKRWRSFIVLFLALSVLAIMAYGIGLWIPAFLGRSYNLSDAQVGHYIQLRGVVAIVFGMIGVVGGGWLCDVFQRRFDDGYVRVCLIAFVFMGIGYGTFTLMPTPELAILMLIPATLGAAAPTAAGAAAVISIAPPHMRAQITALYYLVLNFVGLFVGPTAIALVTDYYFKDETKIRYSMWIVATTFSIIGILLLIYNRRHFRTAVQEARSWA